MSAFAKHFMVNFTLYAVEIYAVLGANQNGIQLLFTYYCNQRRTGLMGIWAMFN